MTAARVHTAPALVTLALLAATGGGPLAAQPSPVRGLRPGESVVPLVGDAAGLVLARVVDAATGAPLAGATVELWTEDASGPGGLVARGVTGLSGHALLRGGREAEKARVRAPGFAATVVCSADLAEPLRLPRQQPLRGRVVDLDGRPVAGALVRTRQGCAHAPSAAEAQTGPDGRFELAACPADDAGAELEVLAPGHGAVSGVDVALLRRRVALTGHGEIEVPERAACRVRVLDAGGAPATGRLVAATGERPIRSARVDEAGLCTLLPFAQGREAVLALVDARGTVPLTPILFAPGTTPVLSPVESPPRSPARAALRVQLDPPPGLAAREVPVQVLDRDGVARHAPGTHEVAQGKVQVTIGRAFSGFAEETSVLDVGPEGAELRLRPAREPCLRVRLPAGGLFDVHVQAGADSVSLERLHEDGGEAALCVPQDARVVLSGRDRAGARRRAHLARAEDGVALDLAAAATVVTPALRLDARPRGELRIAVTDEAGEPLADAEAALRAAPVDAPAARGPGELVWSLPAGLPVTVEVSAPGHVPVLLAAEAGDADQPQRVAVTLRREALLTLAGAVTAVEGLGSWEPGRPLAVPPGPVQAVLRRASGRPLLVDLRLQPGERRLLTVE